METSLFIVLVSAANALIVQLANWLQKKTGIKVLNARLLAGIFALIGGFLYATYVTTVPSLWKETMATIASIAWPGSIGIYELLIKPLEKED